jgi:hypothetical protein
VSVSRTYLLSPTVADAVLTAGTVTANGGVEGVTPTSLSATFTDANLTAPTRDFSGTLRPEFRGRDSGKSPDFRYPGARYFSLNSICENKYRSFFHTGNV